MSAPHPPFKGGHTFFLASRARVRVAPALLIHEARGSPERRSISMKLTIPQIREEVQQLTSEILHGKR